MPLILQENTGALRRQRHAATGRRAFTFPEVLIVTLVLAVLAALVRPRFAPVETIAQQNQLREQLRQLRTQILIYRAQHHGIAPGYPGGDIRSKPTYDAFMAQMTGFTTETGRTSPRLTTAACLGPYMGVMPINPVGGNSVIRVLDSGETVAPGPQGFEGWVYQPSTLTLAANTAGVDTEGMPYFDY